MATSYVTNITFMYPGLLTAKMPIIDFPRLWNDLDEDLRCLDNELAFKKILKSSLLDKYGSFNCTKLFCMSCGNI